MATAGSYPPLLLLSVIMKGSDFSNGEIEKEGERTDREVRPPVYLWEQRALESNELR